MHFFYLKNKNDSFLNRQPIYNCLNTHVITIALFNLYIYTVAKYLSLLKFTPKMPSLFPKILVNSQKYYTVKNIRVTLDQKWSQLSCHQK